MVEDRRARLAALAAKARRTDNIVELNDSQEWMLQDFGSEQEEEQNRRSKRARPADTGAQKEKTALEIALERARAELIVGGASPLENSIQQYKANWDLKRDIQPNLDLLERRTQKAIVQLLRERLEREMEEDEVD
mmetsp:Transcript_20867/g.26953  ORF Transcript_20867/g.26953 Transcript_20867/m.26953 type:complete len:135 (-) Transcript_20867:129-533(-)|eukprot:CAMPEP_0198142772 /NCGR_PEP_ID=MMETSP1443-20131203/5471_1 /TAXON_ID=186043 /ORGANISM="Entomoneis sp., Strain CCMP2396" /LENGTH=134 /DNA_ID=CAMNT_0043805857 /DNA_START=226 /DNA_END=630 /DNA_ORIENTATION=+